MPAAAEPARAGGARPGHCNGAPANGRWPHSCVTTGTARSSYIALQLLAWSSSPCRSFALVDHPSRLHPRAADDRPGGNGIHHAQEGRWQCIAACTEIAAVRCGSLRVQQLEEGECCTSRPIPAHALLTIDSKNELQIQKKCNTGVRKQTELSVYYGGAEIHRTGIVEQAGPGFVRASRSIRGRLE